MILNLVDIVERLKFFSGMLRVKNLHVNIDSKEVLKGLNLSINPGETHAIMGPNGSGKSTTAGVLSGKKELLVISGEIDFFGKSLLELSPEDRANSGIFVAWQYPVEIPGVNIASFLKAALNSKRKYLGLEDITSGDFLKLFKEKLELINLDEKFLYRTLEGLSGGERKKIEILQLAILEPKLIILDELDSGLDTDSLKDVIKALKTLQKPNNSWIIITHYTTILENIDPDFVHIFSGGKIAKTGGKELAQEIEKSGFEKFKANV